MITFDKLTELSAEMHLTPIKGKGYATVNERVKAFRKLIPEGAISTEVISLTGEVGQRTITIKATIYDENGKILATGISDEVEGSSNINKTSFVENCETSAVGRAIGFLGLGIDEAMCTAEEVNTAEEKRAYKQEQDFEVCADCGNLVKPATSKSGKFISRKQVIDESQKRYGKILCADCMQKMKES